MRILFDSKLPEFKDPFGTLTPNQSCRLCIHIPSSVAASDVQCVIEYEDGTPALAVPMGFSFNVGGYDLFAGSFQLCQPGLYFYYFRIVAHTGPFRLFKYGDDTNMEAGDKWQVSCIPADFTTPSWAKGASIYQVFPDRFHRSGFPLQQHPRCPQKPERWQK